MPSWIGLPTETRKAIIDRMDLRTRFRFRRVSRSEKELVDAVPLFIPQIVFNVESETNAKLTFYTAIEKSIDVVFEKQGKQQCTVKVTETSFNNVIELGSPRRVTLPDAPMLALTVFRNVAMGENTICGGVELHSTDKCKFSSPAKTRAFFGDRLFQTRTLSVDNSVSGELMTRCSEPILEELIQYDPCSSEGCYPDGTRKPKVQTYTNRLKTRISNDRGGNALFGWEQQYAVTGEADNTKVLPEEDLDEILHDNTTVIHGDKDISLNHDNGQHKFYNRVSPCGVMFRMTTFDVADEDVRGCEMRRACPNCADPFEHWYFMKTAPSVTDSIFLEDTWKFGPNTKIVSEHVLPIQDGIPFVQMHLSTFKMQHMLHSSGFGDHLREKMFGQMEAGGAELREDDRKWMEERRKEKRREKKREAKETAAQKRRRLAEEQRNREEMSMFFKAQISALCQQFDAASFGRPFDF